MESLVFLFLINIKFKTSLLFLMGFYLLGVLSQFSLEKNTNFKYLFKLHSCAQKLSLIHRNIEIP